MCHLCAHWRSQASISAFQRTARSMSGSTVKAVAAVSVVISKTAGLNLNRATPCSGAARLCLRCPAHLRDALRQSVPHGLGQATLEPRQVTSMHRAVAFLKVL